jgi:hypothetical protein
MESKNKYGLDPSKYPANIGKPWLDDEVLQLLQGVRKKKTIEEIAEEHKRTVGGIKSRLRQIATDYHNEGRSIEQIEKFTGLTTEEITDAIERRKVGEMLRERRAKEKAAAKHIDSVSKPQKQTSIKSFTEAQPTIKDLIEILKDVQQKVTMILERNA